METTVRTLAVVAMIAAAAVATGIAGQGTADRFEMIKKLEGEWLEVGEDGVPTDRVITSFRLTAAGTAMEETLFAGGEHEMMTLYHLDGEDLVLTHYCINGNQPRMRADVKSEPGTIAFKCAGGFNMKAEDEKHMHHATIVWKDDDHIRTEWQEFTGGVNTYTASFNLARK